MSPLFCKHQLSLPSGIEDNPSRLSRLKDTSFVPWLVVLPLKALDSEIRTDSGAQTRRTIDTTLDPSGPPRPAKPRGISFDVTPRFHTLSECVHSLQAVLSDERHEKGVLLRDLNSKQLEYALTVGIESVAFLQNRFTLLGATALPSIEQSDTVKTLLRDAMLLCHFAKASLRRTDWIQHYASFLYIMRFWDSGSIVKTNEWNRRDAYRALLGFHTGKEAESSGLDCPVDCLKSFFSVLWQLNPACVLEAVGWLGDVAGSLDRHERRDKVDSQGRGWLPDETETMYAETNPQEVPNENTQDDVANGEDAAYLLEDEGFVLDETRPAESAFQIPHLRNCVDTVSRVLADLQLDAPTLLLQTFGRIGGTERKLLLNLFGVKEHGTELQDIASTLAAITYNTSQGRFARDLADNLDHFHRAIELIGDLRREWSSLPYSQYWFRGEGSRGDFGYATLQTTLDQAEEALKCAISELPISPNLVDRRWLRETFYFSFLVDHENFWQYLFRWIRKNRSDLAKHKNPNIPKRMFEYFEESRESGSIYLNHPQWYMSEHQQLIDYILSKVKIAWQTYAGVSRFDFCRAYAYWRYHPSPYPDAYRDLLILPQEPDLRPTPGSQSADRKLLADLDHARALAKEQKKRTFCVVVSGDGGYTEPLNALHEREGVEYQYWYFASQNVARHLQHLELGINKVDLEAVLELGQFRLRETSASGPPRL